MNYKPLSREFLLSRGYCCNSGCVNCPYTDMNDTQIKIMSTAGQYHQIQNEQCDPLLDSIANDLKKIYPKMTREEQEDWALDCINREPAEVFEILRQKYEN